MKQPCKCGRRWYARWYGRNEGYRPICPGCGKTPKNCDCLPLKEKDCKTCPHKGEDTFHKKICVFDGESIEAHTRIRQNRKPLPCPLGGE